MENLEKTENLEKRISILEAQVDVTECENYLANHKAKLYRKINKGKAITKADNARLAGAIENLEKAERRLWVLYGYKI